MRFSVSSVPWAAGVLVAGGLAGCQPSAEADPAGKAGTTDAGCDPLTDADGDGLDACTEADLGTDDTRADSDGDGATDGEEVDCRSDPLDTAEQCYACGWDRGDPGTLTATGAAEGDTIANLSFVDQCGESVDLWDFAGTHTVLFMTAAWCPQCLEEARALPDEAATLAAETGVPVQGIVALYEGRTAGVPTADDVVPYAEEIDAETFPVLGDTASALLDAVPYDGTELPGVCLLSPQMVLLTCGAGQGQLPGLADHLD